MEEVLDVYARPYDPRYPVLCMDEQPIQLLKETRTPIAGTKKHPRRVDYEYEYERAGTASIFMFCEPLAGWRQVCVRERRTKVDWAQEMESLLQTRYQSAREGHFGLRQPEHAYQGGFLRSILLPPTPKREAYECDSWNSATRRSVAVG